MRKTAGRLAVAILVVAGVATPSAFGQQQGPQIVHDAEYYILEAQNGQVWAVEDGQLDARLAELREQYGTPPNIVHLMWDDQPVGAVGVPAIQQLRGYETPNLNRMAEEGMLFTRMYTAPGCTPTRASAWTGQLARRTGMYTIGFPIEYAGMPAETVTIAEVLSQAGYATGFYGKLHLGDLEQNYPHNQGYDESFTALYNQVASLWNVEAEAANATIGLKQELLAENPFRLDDTFIQDGYVFYIEGEKGGETREWCGTTNECYKAFDAEAQERTLAFIRRNAEEDRPFYVSWWPLMTSFIPDPMKTTVQRGLVGEAYHKNLDPAVGELVDTLQELGIAENTLVIAMADNGPMTHNPPQGAGLGEGFFRGGKGDFLEGGVRVAAQAWWPGVIEPDQVVGDMIHITDLFTTFSRLAGATPFIPTDRVIDGVDQTSLLVNGQGYSRRDHVFIYAGPNLAATVKEHYKIHWMSDDPGQAAVGITAVYDLLNDHREVNPITVGGFHFKEPFRRMRARHEIWIERYPHQEAARGPAYTGIVNARPETLDLITPPLDFQSLPFDLLEFIDFLDKLPFDPTGEPSLGGHRRGGGGGQN
jgi:arylsulfatase A-like enzyme